jgi:uncharacterized membrane protein required for colicin V production
MFWDALITVFSVATCMNGWHRGFSRSLRGLIAMVLSILGAAYVYPALAGWLYSKIDLNAAQATIAAYLICLFLLMSFLIAVLSQLFNSYWPQRPWLIDRLGGVLYGCAKAIIVVVLSFAMSLKPVHLSSAPPGRMQLGIFAPLVHSTSQYFAPRATSWAQQLINSELGSKYILAKF